MHVVAMGSTIAATEFYGPLNQLLTRIANEPKFHGFCWCWRVQDPGLGPSDPSLPPGQGETESWRVALAMLVVAVPPSRGGPTCPGWKTRVTYTVWPSLKFLSQIYHKLGQTVHVAESVPH